MEYSTKKEIGATQLNKLWNAIGWSSRDPNKWKNALSKSSFVISVWDAEKLIGLGRILEDGVMCMFYDIAVHPDYQRRGIGISIMNKLIDKVKDKRYVSIGLFTWEGNPANIQFYKKFGFEKVDTGMELEKYMLRE